MNQHRFSKPFLVIYASAIALGALHLSRMSGDAPDFFKGLCTGMIIACFALVVIAKRKSQGQNDR